jgi:uncharacterized protein
MRRSVASLQRRCARLLVWLFLVWLFLVGLALWLLCAWMAAREITRPARRPLQDYHQVILQAPAAHGVTLSPFSLADGTPALLCRPDPQGTLDKRGTLLRSQLRQRGIALSPVGTENNATLVLLHGRRGRKEDNLPVAVRFCAAGFRCLLLDLPAHGDHPLPLASYGPREAHLPRQALLETSSRFAFAPQPAALWGMSMGGSVAVHAAAHDSAAWDALVIVASFDQLAPVIRRQTRSLLGQFLGTPFYATLRPLFHWRTGVSLDSIQPAALGPLIHAPTLVAHGDDDPLIPLSSARRLHDAVASPAKQWVNVGSGTHGNVLITPYPLFADMTAWYLRHLVP